MINYFLLNLLLLESTVYIILKSKHAYHMLQLESYKNERYTGWMKKNKTIKYRELLLLLPSAILFFSVRTALIANMVYMLLLILVRGNYTSKKPIVYTARIKRMYFTEIVIIAIIIALSNVCSIYISISLNILAIFSHIFILSINVVNTPVEKSIQRKFYKMARRKLKDSEGLEIIGITGSYGKTSVKNIIGTILNQKYNTLITPESYNTTMGVVRTINEKLNSTHQVFVCEMGAKCVGDIKEICDLVEPEYGVLTAIGPQHMETFKTIENVRDTKMELIKSIPQDGVSFVNWEDENINKCGYVGNNIKYGMQDTCDYYASNVEINEMGSEFDVNVKANGNVIHVKTKLLGTHNIINIVGAVAVADKLGLSADEIGRGVRYIKPIEHRLELKKHSNGLIIIDDAYNSNTKGATMALETLGRFENRKRIVITPGIVDLGNKSEEYNKKLGKDAANNADYIILVGKRQTEYILNGIKENGYDENNIYMAENLKDALDEMNKIADGNSVVLFENDLPDNYL